MGEIKNQKHNVPKEFQDVIKGIEKGPIEFLGVNFIYKDGTTKFVPNKRG